MIPFKEFLNFNEMPLLTIMHFVMMNANVIFNNSNINVPFGIILQYASNLL